MKPRIEITAAELLDALADAHGHAGPEDARTLNELIADTLVPRDRLLDALRALRAQGRLTVVSVVRESILGTRVRVPAYLIAPAPKKRKRA